MADDPNRMIIAVTNQKGGCAKTTTSVNLASSLASLGKRVLLIDMDPQGNATSGFGIEKNKLKRTIYDLLMDEDEDFEDPSAFILPTKKGGCDIIPANIHLSGAEIELATRIGRETRLKEGIEKLIDNYDYVFIDTPPSLGLLTINALTAAKWVLIPVQTEYYALEGMSLLMNTIRLVQKRINKDLKLMGVVLTMFERQQKLCILVAEEIRKYFKDQVYETVIPRNVKLSEAPSHGLPVDLYDPRSKGARAYSEMAQEFIRREPALLASTSSSAQ